MLIEKEVIGPGTIWGYDPKTMTTRKRVVTVADVERWCKQGNEMLSLGLTVPLPCEHDFDAHPMTPAEKLKSNAGWVKEYKQKGDRLFSILDVQDAELAKKLPDTVRWTSPWFSSFVDGTGRKWDDVIAHLALTTRPRIIDQAPFPSIAAAIAAAEPYAEGGLILSKAGMLNGDKPEYPIAFSLYSGIALSEDDIEEDDDDDEEEEETPKNKLSDDPGDAKMDKVLCDLLCILGVNMPENVSGSEFKKTLYMAAMAKIKELSAKPPAPAVPAPGTPSPVPGKKPVTQEQHPMYMSLEDINAIEEPTMKNIALSMYNENVKLRAERDADAKTVTSLRDAKLKEEAAKRLQRVIYLSRLSPKVKADLDVMLALPSMALSMGDEGIVIDPLAQTLSILEKGLSDLPRLLTTETIALSIVAQPTDGEMSQETIDATADSLARMMGCPPEKKAG